MQLVSTTTNERSTPAAPADEITTAVSQASLLPENKTQQVFKEVFNNSLFTKGTASILLQINQDSGPLYNEIKYILELVESTPLHDGKKDLLLEAIKLVPDIGAFYVKLASILNEDETVAMNGKELNKKDLCVKAIELAPELAISYDILACSLKKDEFVIIKNFAPQSQQDLLVKFVELNPNHAPAYTKLARVIENDTIVFIAGKKLCREDLFLRSFELASSKEEASRALYNLACILEKMKTVSIKGKVQNKKDLLILAIAFNPKNVRAIINLANILKDEIVVINQEKLSKKDLLLRAIDLDPMNVRSYGTLALTLNPDEPVVIGKEKLNARDLYLKAIGIDPNFAALYYYLARTLHDNEEITINSVKMNKRGLLELAYQKGWRIPPILDEILQTLKSDEKVILSDNG